MAEPRILIVGCGFPQLGLLRFCKNEGLHVVGLDLNPEAVGRSTCDEFVQASTTDQDAIARAVVDGRLDGLTTGGSDHAVLPTALAAEQAGKPFYLPSWFDDRREAVSSHEGQGLGHAANDLVRGGRRVASGEQRAHVVLVQRGGDRLARKVEGFACLFRG